MILDRSSKQVQHVPSMSFVVGLEKRLWAVTNVSCDAVDWIPMRPALEREMTSP